MRTGPIVVFALVLAFASCTSLTPAGERVRVTSNADVVRGCTLLGEVKGADRMWGGYAGQGIAENNAWNELKNRAAAMGADTVFLTTSSTGFSGARAIGEAYRCGVADATKQAMLSKVTVSNFSRQATSDAQLVGTFDLANNNAFAITSIVVECSVAGVAVQNATRLPALGANQHVTTPSITFTATPVPDGPPVCRAVAATP
jgi:hypothetical protein